MPSVLTSLPTPSRRRALPGLLATLTLLAVSVALPRPSVFAQGAQPAKKDSSARTKPKDVTLTPSVTPVEAKAGETVTYQVTAKLNPGWHIYTYAKEQTNEGPRNTQFDLFDPAGLSPAGDWKASKTPERKKEPAFPEIDAVEFFEEEVTWSLELKVPADAAPGPRTIRCQASYQICDAKSCSFPGRWTLPDVTVNVVAGNAQAKAAEPAAAPHLEAVAGGPAPEKKDTPARLKPKGATLTAFVEPAEAKPGQKVQVRVTAQLDPGLHIYAVKEQPETGPTYTRLELFDPAGLKPSGDWTPDAAPIVKPDPAFNNEVVEYFEGKVTWSLPLEVPADAAPGPRKLKVQAGYQICDAVSCSIAGRWTLPEATLTVVSNDGAAAPTSTPANIAASPAPAQGLVEPTRKGIPGEDRIRGGGARASSNVMVAEATEPGAAAPPPAAAAPVSEVQQKAREGIIPLMIASALGGLLALVMPCVWPMVPITVNFFLKQGQKKEGGNSTTGLAIAYCLAIIGVFTAVGVLCSFFLSATALPQLANNPWLNFFVAGLFFAFGLSLLGLFEISLPSSFLNASARGESRGGLIGVMFMALTLTITSFTCTFPVVGGLLVMASTGEFFYPIIGLATFATVVALPFFLLALSPGLLSKMPRSGDWMNTVKVVGGLIEIGAAFKFLNTAELAWVTPENAWFDAEFVLTAWVVLAAVCGLYLLGLFRTDHDHDEVKVGPMRLILGTSFLGLALYLAPALFGRPPQSLVYDRLVIGLLPPDAANLAAPTMIAGGEGQGAPAERERHATDSDPKIAERQEARFHGVWWGFSYEAALEKAKAEKKPVLIDFTGLNCANCRLMEQRVLPKPEVASVLERFVTIQLYTPPAVPIPSLNASQRSDLAERNANLQVDLTNQTTNPLYTVVTPDGRLVDAIGGYNEPGTFIEFLNKSLKKAEVAGKVADAR